MGVAPNHLKLNHHSIETNGFGDPPIIINPILHCSRVPLILLRSVNYGHAEFSKCLRCVMHTVRLLQNHRFNPRRGAGPKTPWHGENTFPCSSPLQTNFCPFSFPFF